MASAGSGQAILTRHADVARVDADDFGRLLPLIVADGRDAVTARGGASPFGQGYFNIAHFGAGAGGTGGVIQIRLNAYARTATNDRPYGVANDYIGGRLGLAIGLPVPPGALIELYGDKIAYTSLAFTDKYYSRGFTVGCRSCRVGSHHC